MRFGRPLRRRFGCLSVLIIFVLVATAVAFFRRAGAQERPYETYSDIAYAVQPNSDPDRTSLDVYAVSNAASLPVMVFVHGGGWAFGDKTYVQEKPAYFTSQGFVFVSINYRFVPDIQFPTNVQDVADALVWVRDHIADYGGDPERLFVMGHSAGAHLAALVATDERYLQQAGGDASMLDGVVLLDGAGYDLPLQITQAGRREQRIYEEAFGSDPALWEEASPITYVASGIGIPPFLIIHIADRDASRVQAQGFAAALNDAGVEAIVYEADGKTHGTLNRELGLPGDEPTEWVRTWLAERLASGQ